MNEILLRKIPLAVGSLPALGRASARLAPRPAELHPAKHSMMFVNVPRRLSEVRSTMPRFTTMHPMYVYMHVHTSSILGRVVTPTLLGFLGRRSASLCLMTRVMRAMQNITRGGKPAAVSLHRTSFFEDRAKNVLISCWC